MKKNYLIILALFLCFKPLNAEWKASGYDSVNYKNFRSNSVFRTVIDPENIDYPLINAAVFFATNEMRVRLGKKPLGYAPELEKAAWLHSKDMVKRNYFSHTNPYDRTRRTPEKRGGLAGIKNPKIAENIASSFGVGYKAGKPVYYRGSGKFSYSSGGSIIPNHTYLSLADALVKQWMNSPGHRANILSTNGVEMGCGVFFFRDKKFNNMLKCKATQNFQWFYRVKR